MRLIETSALKPSMKLARSIYDEQGRVLISKGFSLTDSLIHRLLDFSVSFVYIEDKRTEGIVCHPVITEQTRSKARKVVKNTFDVILDKDHLAKTFPKEKLTKELLDTIRLVLDDLMHHKEALSLMTDMCAYNNYLFNHSMNVTIYSLALAKELGFSQKHLEEIGLGAMLHDVGKLLVPLEVLQKPGRLTDEEFDTIKQHTTVGFELLRHTPTMPLLTAHCAFQHHERLDGSGYPRGIKEKEIHDYAKVIAICDVFDAVTSHRIYRKAMLPHEGLEILYAGSGTQFHKDYVEAFRRVIAVYPVGLMVQLSDGRKGIVASIHSHLSERPVVRILEENGQEIVNPYEIDLQQELNITIVDCETKLTGRM